MKNRLCFGDDLDVLREDVAHESITPSALDSFWLFERNASVSSDVGMQRRPVAAADAVDKSVAVVDTARPATG